MLKTGAIFTDAHFFLSLLSKPPTPDFSLKDFSESHILFFLDRGFFSCFSYALHKTQLFTPPQWQIYTRVSIQGPEHCDDSEQGSYTELLLMRVYYSWFHISSYLPQLFCRCLSSQALTFHLNCRRIQFLSQGVWLSSDLCDCHWIDLDCQELRRFEIWVLGEPWGLKLWDCKNNYKILPGKKKQLGNCWHTFSWGFVVGY